MEGIDINLKFQKSVCGQHAKIVFPKINQSKDTKAKLGIFRQTDMDTTMCCNQTSMESITKTHLYNFDLLKPHFYIVKLGFTGVFIIFLILLKNIDCGYSLEIAFYEFVFHRRQCYRNIT